MGLFASIATEPSGAAQAYPSSTPVQQPSALSTIGTLADIFLTGGLFHALNQRALQQGLMRTQAMDRSQMAGMFTPGSVTAVPAAPLPNPQSETDLNLFKGGQYGPVPTQQFGGDGQNVTPAHIPTPQEFAPVAAQAAAHGTDISPFLAAIQAAQPDIQVVNGVAYDRKSTKPGARIGVNLSNVNNRMVDTQNPDNANITVPQVDKGQVVTYDARGNPIGVMNLAGNADAQAQVAGATAGATERAKAQYDLVDVPLANGSTVKVPRSLAANILGGGAGNSLPGFGVSQSPAAKALAEDRAKSQGKLEADMQGARAAMGQVDDQTSMIRQNLHDMLGETQDPQTGKWVKTRPSMISGLSAGSGTDVIEHLPFLNQQAKDLAAKLDTVRNGTSFNALQAIKGAMAAAGDGSAASVRMTDQTARMLGEINGSLEQNQSPAQMEATIRRHLDQLDALDKGRHDLFAAQYADIQRPQPGSAAPKAPSYGKQSQAAPSRAELEAEARRRGLIK